MSKYIKDSGKFMFENYFKITHDRTVDGVKLLHKQRFEFNELHKDPLNISCFFKDAKNISTNKSSFAAMAYLKSENHFKGTQIFNTMLELGCIDGSLVHAEIDGQPWTLDQIVGVQCKKKPNNFFDYRPHFRATQAKDAAMNALNDMGIRVKNI